MRSVAVGTAGVIAKGGAGDGNVDELKGETYIRENETRGGDRERLVESITRLLVAFEETTALTEATTVVSLE